MKSFKDKKDRSWEISINVDVIKRVRGLANVDLLKAVEGKLVEQLASDPILLCDVVYAICKPDADAKGITDEDFGRSMAGDPISDATTAVMEELVDFFPKDRRALLSKAVRKFRTLEEKILEAADRNLDSGKIDKAVEAELAKIDQEIDSLIKSGSQSGRLPE